MTSRKLRLAEEVVGRTEGYYAQSIIAILKKSLKGDYANSKMKRRFHPKSHGLLKAEVQVEKDLPVELKVGLFKNERTYSAFIRFSNASQMASADYKRGVRGMALRILIPGSEGEKDHDIILTNNKILFPGSPKAYLLSMKGLFINFIYLIPLIINPFNWSGLYRLFRSSIKIPSVFGINYWSGTPYLFGPHQAIKWQARPSKLDNSKMPRNPSEDFLRKKLATDLHSNDFYFDLLVQQQTDPRKEPIENSSRLWKTPFTKVASIKIPKQDFNSASQVKLESEIVFSPWNCSDDHRPLGGNNRIRKVIYEELSVYRKEINRG